MTKTLHIGSIKLPKTSATKGRGYSARNQGGWKHTDESRAKIRAKRAQQVITGATRDKMRQAHLGMKHTAEELRKMSESQRGRVFSEVTRSKMSEWQVGSRNNRWKGGITPFRRKLRNLGRYIQWRSEVLMRDAGVCVECGSADRIEVDHFPVTLKDILAEYNITTVREALTCAELWNVDNGRVLCREHHMEHTYQKQI